MLNIRLKVGKNIRAIRLKSGMSQEDLGFLAGLHRTYVGSVERGERNISIDAIYKISRALKSSLEDLFSPDVVPSKRNKRPGEKTRGRRHEENVLRGSRKQLELLVKERTAGLKMMNAQLRNLLIYLQNAWEEERARFAHDIHDDLGQLLAAIKLELSSLRKKLPDDPLPIAGQVEYAVKLVESCMQNVKRISAELRPKILDHMGLISAIEWQAMEFEKRAGIPCTAVFEPEEIEIDQGRATAVFRILQESLTNVRRHANASEVEVLLKLRAGDLFLQVRDDGRGISDQEATDGNSLGLMGIRERVHAWGGSFAIRGTRNKGTTVIVRIPLVSPRHGAAR
jgi:signal transduction histidine kinase